VNFSCRPRYRAFARHPITESRYSADYVTNKSPARVKTPGQWERSMRIALLTEGSQGGASDRRALVAAAVGW